jgi:hypothetical protein
MIKKIYIIMLNNSNKKIKITMNNKDNKKKFNNHKNTLYLLETQKPINIRTIKTNNNIINLN